MVWANVLAGFACGWLTSCFHQGTLLVFIAPLPFSVLRLKRGKGERPSSEIFLSSLFFLSFFFHFRETFLNKTGRLYRWRVAGGEHGFLSQCSPASVYLYCSVFTLHAFIERKRQFSPALWWTVCGPGGQAGNKLVTVEEGTPGFYSTSTHEKAVAPTPVLLPGKAHGRRRLEGCMQSMGSLRVGHDWAASLSLFTCMHWRRKWQPTAVFLPGESQGRGSLVGCRLWGRTESDTTEVT